MRDDFGPNMSLILVVSHRRLSDIHSTFTSTVNVGVWHGFGYPVDVFSPIEL